MPFFRKQEGVFMDVSIQTLNSRVRVVDPQALLTEEVLKQIVAAVVAHLDQENVLQQERERDTTINRGASLLR
jgi:hypothetical protein